MKKSRYFSCKERDHITYDCPKKGKIAAISKNIDEDSKSQGKE